MQHAEEQDEMDEEMEKVDCRLATMKSTRKMARRQGEEFADEIAYKCLQKKSKTIHCKYN